MVVRVKSEVESHIMLMKVPTKIEQGQVCA